MAPRTPAEKPRWDRYEPLLLEALGVGPLPVSCAPGEGAARGLFMPSFHRDVCLTVRWNPDGAALSFASLDGMGRARVLHAIGVRSGAEAEGPAPTAPTVLECVVPSAARETFLTALSALDRAGLQAPRALGIDGLSLLGELSEPSGTSRFSSWSPRVGTAQHAFFSALHELAWSAFDDPTVRATMEHLHGYLDLGLPWRDLGGDPRRVRLFGRLSWPAPPGLVARFEALTDDAPLLMDMSNFEYMGTGLYPVFRAFARRPGRTAWWGSPSAHAQLLAAGVPPRDVFDGLEPALAWLTEPRDEG